MEKNRFIKKGLSHEILISSGNNDELKEACSVFCNLMEEEVKEFTKNRKLKEKEWERENIKRGNIYFQPEVVIKKSPITIIDAPWGTGKTYFVEEIIKLLNKKENSFFKKIIYLDAWKYATSKDVSKDVISQLIYAFTTISENFKDNYEKCKKNKGEDLKNIDFEEFIKIETEMTIIFIENVERLGMESWEILKCIWRLSEAENLLFVLPMNQKHLERKMHDLSKEDFIEKYIDIKYIKFSQNYLGLLKKMGFDEKNVENLNKFLNYEIEGKNLSIREAEKRIKTHKLLKISKNSEYEMLSVFVNNIWGTQEIIEEHLDNDLDFFVNGLKKMGNIFKNIADFINDFLEDKSFILNTFNKEKNIIFNKIYDYNFYYNINCFYSWNNEFKKIIDNLKNLNGEIMDKNKAIIEENEKIKLDNETWQIKIDKIDKKIKDNKNKIEQEQKKTAEKNNEIADSTKITNWKNAIDTDLKQINELQKFIISDKLEENNTKIKTYKIFLNDIKILIENIERENSEYEKEKDDLFKYKKEFKLIEEKTKFILNNEKKKLFDNCFDPNYKKIIIQEILK
ncbi:MAG: P-loop NTPase fold protein [Metamycoplasmataceae bacterium]